MHSDLEYQEYLEHKKHEIKSGELNQDFKKVTYINITREKYNSLLADSEELKIRNECLNMMWSNKRMFADIKHWFKF